MALLFQRKVIFFPEKDYFQEIDTCGEKVHAYDLMNEICTI